MIFKRGVRRHTYLCLHGDDLCVLNSLTFSFCFKSIVKGPKMLKTQTIFNKFHHELSHDKTGFDHFYLNTSTGQEMWHKRASEMSALMYYMYRLLSKTCWKFRLLSAFSNDWLQLLKQYKSLIANIIGDQKKKSLASYLYCISFIIIVFEITIVEEMV